MAETAPPTAVLDSEALSVLAEPRRRPAALRRAQAVLEAIERRGGFAIVPAPILAEVSRGRRAAGIARMLNRLAVVSTDRAIAVRAGDLLHRRRLGSEHAVDAFVISTAIDVRPAVVLTVDAVDLQRLASEHSEHVAIQPLP